MSWFDEQIRQRKQNDSKVVADAVVNMADAVMGKHGSEFFGGEQAFVQNEINEVLKFYHLKSQKIPDSLTDKKEQLEYLMRQYGIMYRTVRLEKGWYKDAAGAMLGTLKKSGKSVALIPGKISGYSYFDVETGKRKKIGKKDQDLFEEDALAFYKPFPLKKMGLFTLAKYILGILSAADYIVMTLATLAVVFIGMFTPKFNNLLFSYVLPSGSMQVLLSVFIFMICISIAGVLLNTVKNVLIARIDTKMNVSVEAATMMRMMSLPANFFRKYSAGELSSRVSQMNSLCEILVSTVFSTGLTSVFSLVYIQQIFSFAPALAGEALAIITVTTCFSVISFVVQTEITQKQMEVAGKESGMTYAMIAGIQKIKLTGSEKRAFARWGDLYAEEAALLYNPPLFLKINSVISTGISLLGTIVLYYSAVMEKVSVADYYAFNTAYSMVAGAILSLANIAFSVAQIRPALKMIAPIFDEVPETAERKRMLEKISGEVELNHVSFRYDEKMPLILNDLSLKIQSGQYVAIVGKTGCGKSTLMRLLLGFEKPQQGAIYYDGKDLEKLDLKSVRRKIGVVMQNGKLLQGDIYSNIVLSAPWLTQEDAWEAAEIAGIAEDIRKMPMGMSTMISEGSGGISGGQKQRIMIARAIASKPKILMLDEATSALDNPTQKKISEALDSMQCTRIIIAHRLSTIKQCDRVIVLDEGKIIEDGTYQELMDKKGFFMELVARQQVEN